MSQNSASPICVVRSYHIDSEGSHFRWQHTLPSLKAALLVSWKPLRTQRIMANKKWFATIILRHVKYYFHTKKKKKKNRGQNTLHSSVLKSKLAIEFQRTGATITIPKEGLAMHKPTVAENSPLNFSWTPCSGWWSNLWDIHTYYVYAGIELGRQKQKNGLHAILWFFF